MQVVTRKVKQVHNEKDWPSEYSCNFLEPGLCSYEDVGAGIAMLRKETILKMMPTFIGKPVVIDHIDVTPKDFKNYAVGYITKVWYDDYRGWACCTFILHDDKAKEKVARGYSVSCAYDVLSTGKGGDWHAIKFDEEILDGSGTHLALVTSPRYEEAKIEECRMFINSKKAVIKNERKIDIFIDRKYEATTTRSTSLKDAVERYIEKYKPEGKVTATFQEKSKENGKSYKKDDLVGYASNRDGALLSIKWQDGTETLVDTDTWKEMKTGKKVKEVNVVPTTKENEMEECAHCKGSGCDYCNNAGRVKKNFTPSREEKSTKECVCGYSDCKKPIPIGSRIFLNDSNEIFCSESHLEKAEQKKNKNQQKEDSKMIQLFKKANDKAGSEVDPKDPTKQKWNDASAIFVKIENDYVPLSELAKHAKVNEYEPLQGVENEVEVDGTKHNIAELVENYKASKNAMKKCEEEEKEKKEATKNEMKKCEDEEEDKKENEDEEKKDNEDDEEDKENDEDQKSDEKQEEEAETIKKNEKETKKDVKHFVKLNKARENGLEQEYTATIDTMSNRVDRGKSRYGSPK